MAPAAGQRTPAAVLGVDSCGWHGRPNQRLSPTKVGESR